MTCISNGAANTVRKILSRANAPRQFEDTCRVNTLQSNWKRWLLCSTIIAGGYHHG